MGKRFSKRIIKRSHKCVSKHKGEVRTYERKRQRRITCFSLRHQTDRRPINTQTRGVTSPRIRGTQAIVSPRHNNVQRALDLTLEFFEASRLWSAVGLLIGRRVLSRAQWLDIAGFCEELFTPVEIYIWPALGLQPLAARKDNDSARA